MLRTDASATVLVKKSLPGLPSLKLSETGSVPCNTALPSFCTMFKNADMVVDGVGTVDAEIDRWTESIQISYCSNHVWCRLELCSGKN